jgi:hypothetical protein
MKLFCAIVLLACSPSLMNGCRDKKKQSTLVLTTDTDTLLDYGYFTIRVPKGFTNPDTAFVRMIGKPSPISKIMQGERYFLGYTVSMGAPDFSLPDPMILTPEMATYYLHDGADTAYSIITTRPDTIDREKMRRYHTRRDTIDGIGVKVFYPRTTGYGYCGIYSDSIPASSPLLLRGKRISISARNADSAHQALLFKCLRTVRFK